MVVRTAESEKPVKSRSLDRTGLRLLLGLPDSEAGLNGLLVANDGFNLLREFPFVRTATLHCSLVPLVVKNDHGVVDVVTFRAGTLGICKADMVVRWPPRTRASKARINCQSIRVVMVYVKDSCRLCITRLWASGRSVLVISQAGIASSAFRELIASCQATDLSLRLFPDIAKFSASSAHNHVQKNANGPSPIPHDAPAAFKRRKSLDDSDRGRCGAYFSLLLLWTPNCCPAYQSAGSQVPSPCLRNTAALSFPLVPHRKIYVFHIDSRVICET
jgi:hypothetical protein